MTIKIVLPEGDGVKAVMGTKVFLSSGEEVEHVSRIQCDWGPDDILTATITVPVEEVQNFEGVIPYADPFGRPDNGRYETMRKIRRGAK